MTPSSMPTGNWRRDRSRSRSAGYVFMAKQPQRASRDAWNHVLADVSIDKRPSLLSVLRKPFWCPEIGTYALHSMERRNNVNTHLEFGQFFHGHRLTRARVSVANAFAPRLFFRVGIRTVSQEERRYNPMSITRLCVAHDKQ